MVISPALSQLFQSFGLAGFVTLLVNILAPWLERTPLATPGSSTHDATLRALNLLLNVGCAFGAAGLLGQLTNGQAIMAVIGFGIAQATGSHLLYTSGNRAAPATTATYTPVSIALDGKKLASAVLNSANVPSPAPTPAAPPAPSLASVAATSAAAVADAVNQAIAAHTS